MTIGVATAASAIIVLAGQSEGAVLMYPYTAYTAVSVDRGCCAIMEAEDEVTQTAPDSVLPDIAAKNRIDGPGDQFAYPVNPDLGSFAFAESRVDGLAGVGVSTELNYYSPTTFEANAGYVFEITHDEAGPVKVPLTLDIPRMEVGISGFPVLSDITARAEYWLTYEIRREDGTARTYGDVFEFSMEALKLYQEPTDSPYIGVVYTLSKDLWTIVDAGYDFDILAPDAAEILRMPEFRVTLNLPELLPGETMIMAGMMTAFADFGFAGLEGGAQALVGDPFNLASSSGPLIDWVVDDLPDPVPAPVPLPAAGWLMLGSLAGASVLGSAAGCRRSRG